MSEGKDGQLFRGKESWGVGPQVVEGHAAELHVGSQA